MLEPMKTKREIETEAERLMILGRQYRDEQRQESGRIVTTPLPRVLTELPEPRMIPARPAERESESSHAPRRERYIDATIKRGELIYRLMEREVEPTDSGRKVGESPPSVVMVSETSLEPLQAGYELAEEERLARLLEPFTERSEQPDCTDPADVGTVAAVEEILETHLLPIGDRIRTRLEIAEFLEGRLEPSAFITRSIARLCRRDNWCEQMTEHHQMRLMIEEP